eukprot:scaffold1126_cov83-Isochrysis_galbana.AAC.2
MRMMRSPSRSFRSKPIVHTLPSLTSTMSMADAQRSGTPHAMHVEEAAGVRMCSRGTADRGREGVWMGTRRASPGHACTVRAGLEGQFACRVCRSVVP